MNDDTLRFWLLAGLVGALIFGVLTAFAGALSGVAGFVLSRRSDDMVSEAKASAERAREVSAHANERAAKLEKEAAESRERAARFEKEAEQSRLEHEHLKGEVKWRELTQGEISLLIQSFSEIQYPVTISWTSGDSESSSYAHQIGEALRQAGLQVTLGPLFGGDPPYGITVAGNPIIGSQIIGALEQSGLQVTPMLASDMQIVKIFVGPKRPIIL